MEATSLLLIFYLISLIVGAVLFIYSVVFLVTIPQKLERIATALGRIAANRDNIG